MVTLVRLEYCKQKWKTRLILVAALSNNCILTYCWYHPLLLFFSFFRLYFFLFHWQFVKQPFKYINERISWLFFVNTGRLRIENIQILG